MIDKSILKQEYTRFTFHVDRCKIRELCLAVGNDNPLFQDPTYAREQGIPDTPVPLTFGRVILYWGYPQICNIVKEIGFEYKRLLHVSEEYDFHELIYPGDTLTGVITIQSIRHLNHIDFISFMIRYTRDGGSVLDAKMRVAVIEGVIKDVDP